MMVYLSIKFLEPTTVDVYLPAISNSKSFTEGQKERRTFLDEEAKIENTIRVNNHASSSSESNLIELEQGLRTVYEIYLRQGIRDKIFTTFDSRQGARQEFNVGKFTKFL